MSELKRKPINIVEYQPDRQRTPKEAVDFLNDEIDKGNIDHLLVIYREGDLISYLPASDNRDYRNSSILWDVEQWKKWFI